MQVVDLNAWLATAADVLFAKTNSSEMYSNSIVLLIYYLKGQLHRNLDA